MQAGNPDDLEALVQDGEQGGVRQRAGPQVLHRPGQGQPPGNFPLLITNSGIFVVNVNLIGLLDWKLLLICQEFA